MALAMAGNSSGQNSSIATEAPSGYDNQPNGLTDAATFTMDRGKFEETETIGDGLGPSLMRNPAASAIKTRLPAQPTRSKNSVLVIKTTTATLWAPRRLWPMAR